MTQVIKPIETRYAGCHFRSRIEARWAVFFDHLGVGWEYEPQGFDLHCGPYLPDFLLDLGDGVWWEVKGATPTQVERNLCWELFEATHRHVYLAHGAIPRDRFDEPRIEHVGGARVRWFIQPGAIGFIPDFCDDQKGTNHPLLLSAYRAARSARFEHGESA
jgi:hypothetical protein